jgi:predicted nucleic acid-binding protein
VRAVVDTNVVAYYLLGTPGFASEAKDFWQRVVDPLAPALWEAEFANVVWMAARSGVVAPEDAPAKLDYAAQLGIHSIASRTLWRGALRRALESGVAAYDTLFVELADRESLPLATFDERLLTRFPLVAKRPKTLGV